MLHIKKTIGICMAGVLGAAFLNGCGGSSLTSSAAAPSPYSDPTVQGLSPSFAAFAGRSQGFQETSGFGSPDAKTGYITAAVDSDSKAIPGVALSTSPSNPAIKTTPLGFAPGGQFFSSTANGPFGAAVNPGSPVIFRASIATGVDPGTNTAPPIVPSSVKLTSPEAAWTTVAGLKTDDPTDAPNGYLPLGLNVNTAGPLANGTYVTGTPDATGAVATGSIISFPMPFATTGLHTVRVTVADSRAVVHHTDFKVLVLSPTDSAIVVQAVDSNGAPVGGATVTVDSGQIAPAAPGTDQTTTDPLTGVGIIFVTPTMHTITLSGQDAKGNTITGTSTIDLTSLAGAAYVSIPDPKNMGSFLPYTVTLM